jgi:hypothetical protein
MSNDSALEDLVRDEVIALHDFFVGWFSGKLAKDTFETQFLARFDSEFILIPPAGVVLPLKDFQTVFYDAHGSNPDFKIAIRNVRLCRVMDGFVLATYEEWQRNAIASDPPDNGRVASVIFANTTPIKWLHVHETWLPEAIASAGPYDF